MNACELTIGYEARFQRFHSFRSDEPRPLAGRWPGLV